MARGLLSFRVSDQTGIAQSTMSVTVYEIDGVTLLTQTLFAGPTGPETRTNPLTTNDYGLAVAYVDAPQRAIVSVAGVPVVVDITDDPGDIAAVTTPTVAGDLPYGSAPGVLGRLPIGLHHQELIVNAGATAPSWASGVLATLTAAGDMVYANAANAVSRLSKGSAFQSLVMNAGATAPSWANCVLQVAAAAGDTFYATGANAIAKLTKGTAFQELTMNAGATAPQWASGTLATIAAAGDTIYGTGANAIGRLVKGTAFQSLTMNAGATAPSWASCALALAAAAGDIFYATGANALAKLTAGSATQVLHGGATPSWSAVATADIAANAITTRPASVAGSTNPTTTNTAVAALADPSVSINCPVTSDVYVWVNGEYNDSAGGAIVDYHVRIGGGAWTLVAQTSQPSSAGRYFLSGHHVFAGVTSGAKTIEVGNGSSTGASTITHYGAGRRMTAIGVAR